MKPIAVFYHCLFYWKQPPKVLDHSIPIVQEQIDQMAGSGLIDAASKCFVGINGGSESSEIADVLIPPKFSRLLHGLQCRSENRTIVAMHDWCKANPGYAVLYLHAKGASHDPNTDYGRASGNWRRAMMDDLVTNWRQCVKDIEAESESVGCHFMRGMADGTQNIWAGNFFWVTSDYVATLPSMYDRDRIKTSGIDALESRYEAEVWIGFGKRLPRVTEYKPNGGNGIP